MAHLRCVRIVKFIKSAYSTSATSEVNKNEFDYYTNLSSVWWDKKGIMEPLLALNRIRIPFIRDGLINCGVLDKNTATGNPHPLQNINILDVGCGGGFLSEGLARIGSNVVGLDANRELINAAKSHAKKDPTLDTLKYVVGTVEEFKENNTNVFDVVVISEVIEHIYEKEEFLKNCISLLKPGGSLFMTTPNRTLVCWLSVIVVGEAIGLLPKGIHQYSLFIQPEELENIVNSYGCHTKSIQGFLYNPLLGTASWTNHKMIHYAFHAVKTDIK